jgi:hypothetical protein
MSARIGLIGDHDPAASAHRALLATLYRPERAALAGRDHPLVRAFVEAARARGRFPKR